MEKYILNKEKINLHNIIFAITTNIDYEMTRYYLLGDLEDLKYDEFVVLEGHHCSCYDFDDTEWEALKFSRIELLSLAQLKQKSNNSWSIEEKKFYRFIIDYFNEPLSI